MSKIQFLAALLCGALLMATAPAAAEGNKANNPVGTWLVEVSFPPGPPEAPPAPPPFREFLTFHHNGTLTETNGALHGSPAPGPLNLTGSDGFGSWERIPGGKIRFSFLKMVFCGPAAAGPWPPGCGIEGQHLGYLRVRAEATLRGDTYSGGESFTDLLIGPDPGAPVFYIPFGPASSEGKRIPTQAP